MTDSKTTPPEQPIRGGFGRQASVWAAVGVGAVVLVVVTGIGRLYLDNLYGPLGGHRAAGVLVGFACGVLTGAAAYVVSGRVARRSRALLVALVVVVLAGGWVLWPRQIDVSESFVPRDNPRWECAGWSFRHYPPGTSDASETTYCVGFETRIANG